MAALIADLKERGLLDNTLVIWMGEFGRAPKTGSQHYARAWTSVLAGGGVKGGQVIGSTDAQRRRRQGPSDLVGRLHGHGVQGARDRLHQGIRGPRRPADAQGGQERQAGDAGVLKSTRSTPTRGRPETD